MMYNLVDSSGNRIKNLNLTPDNVCKIFTGQIRDWSDPQLVANNPELSSFQNQAINVVVRTDSAGESYVLSQYCIAVDPSVWTAFKTFILAQQGGQFVSDLGLSLGQPVSVWPSGLMDGTSSDVYQERATSGSDGVANAVADPSNGVDAITYDAAGYAKVRDFPVASVQNAAGQFVQPTETNVTVALAYATGNGDGTFHLNFNGADPRAYFPSTYSYILAATAVTAKFTAGQATTLQQFLCYAVGAGQVYAPTLAYARL
jgi:phosphate transport system substrate-binding protein